MKQIDRESISAAIKLGFFLAFTGMFTLVLMLILSNGSFGNRTEYKAVFGDVTGVAKGDDVRIAGVVVGSVKKVDIVNRDKALVTFAVDSDTPLTANTNATLKFRNLVGQRYMALTQGADGAKKTLKPNTVIPESARRKPSTSTSCSTVSSRSSRRCRRETPTSSPTRSCRRCRARAATFRP